MVLECTEQMQKEHIGKIAKMEQEIITLQSTLATFGTFNETLYKLQSLNEKAMECISRQERTMDDITKTMLDITDKLRTLDSRVVKLETQEVDSNALRIEKTKSKYILIGVIIAAILSLLGIIIPLILSKGVY